MDERRPGILGLIIRIIVNSIVLLIVSALVPGFFVAGWGTAILAAVVIAVLDYLVEMVFKIDATPFGRGITGFIVAAIIIYLTQYFVAGVTVTMWGAIIGALLIGLINLIIPGRVM
ncbi:phage holin family protein [Fonticella tunisiensis]